MPDELLCYRCGYDLRAHPQDGVCPECGGSVAESRKVAAIPRRPAWKESDPRWRRRILAGTWILVLIPLMDLLQKYEWASLVPVPSLFGYGSMTLNESFLRTLGLYQSIVFCMGVVLLFSKERGRRKSRLDWTCRWGVICSYVVALLSAAIILFVPFLVLTGISALFLGMRPKYQPGVTGLLVELSTTYLRYGPYPKPIAFSVQIMVSSITILLACVPLWEALCGSGLKRVAKIILVPLALFSLMNIAKAGWVMTGHAPVFIRELLDMLGTYFRPTVLVWNTNSFPGQFFFSSLWDYEDFAVEVVKWGIIFAIAVWLSIAQIRAWGKGKFSK